MPTLGPGPIARLPHPGAAPGAAPRLAPEGEAKLTRVLAVLGEWRGRMNLIGPREWDRVRERHVADSLQLLSWVAPHHRVVDLGSGAGFPGLVLACAADAGAGGEVVLVESRAKKAAFLREAIEAAGLPARVAHSRAETLDPWPADWVTARAVAPLDQLLDYARPWMTLGAQGLFHKGRNWQTELTQAAKSWTLEGEAFASLVSEPAAESGAASGGVAGDSGQGAGVILQVREAARRDS